MFSTSGEPGTARLHEVRICPQWQGESQNRYWAISTNLFNLTRSSWLVGRLKTDSLTKLFSSDNEIERGEDRLETEVGHNTKEQTFLNWSQKSESPIFTHTPLTRGHAPGVISCLLQLSKQPTTKKRPLWQMTTWRTARGSCKAVFAWRSRRQRPSRSSRGSFRSCRRIPWQLRRSLYPAGIAGPPPDRGSVPGEPVGHRGLLPRSGVASPVAAS